MPCPIAQRGTASLVLVDEAHVDLRALQLARVVDIDALPLAEEVERGLTHLAMAIAGGLGAAERQVRLRPDRAVVDVAQAGVKVSDAAEGKVMSRVKSEVDRPYFTPFTTSTASSQVFNRNDRLSPGRRSLLGDAGRGAHVGKDGGLEEGALGQPAVACRLPADPGLPRHAPIIGRPRCARRPGRLITGPTSVASHPVANTRGHSLAQRLGELVVDGTMDDDPRSGRAALAAGPERGPHHAVERQVQGRSSHTRSGSCRQAPG